MDNVQAIIDFATANTDAHDIGGVKCLVVPAGYEVKELDHLLPAPTRKSGHTIFDGLNSYLDFTSRHKEPSSSIYFKRDKDRQFRTVFNDHGIAAGWGDFTARHSLKFSRKFAAWSNKIERQQKEFAEFLEDRLVDVVKPDGATLFEIATTLEATQTAVYSSALKMSNGDTRFTYNKETKAGNGTLTVPEKITVLIPIWENAPNESIDIKLRYKLREDKLTFKLEIERFDDLVDAAIDSAAEKVRAATGLPVYYGSVD